MTLPATAAAAVAACGDGYAAMIQRAGEEDGWHAYFAASVAYSF